MPKLKARNLIKAVKYIPLNVVIEKFLGDYNKHGAEVILKELEEFVLLLDPREALSFNILVKILLDEEEEYFNTLEKTYDSLHKSLKSALEDNRISRNKISLAISDLPSKVKSDFLLKKLEEEATELSSSDIKKFAEAAIRALGEDGFLEGNKLLSDLPVDTQKRIINSLEDTYYTLP